MGKDTTVSTSIPVFHDQLTGEPKAVVRDCIRSRRADTLRTQFSMILASAIGLGCVETI